MACSTAKPAARNGAYRVVCVYRCVVCVVLVSYPGPRWPSRKAPDENSLHLLSLMRTPSRALGLGRMSRLPTWTSRGPSWPCTWSPGRPPASSGKASRWLTRPPLWPQFCAAGIQWQSRGGTWRGFETRAQWRSGGCAGRWPARGLGMWRWRVPF